MRNLKRVLSLAMASVMLIGMMVVGAGAASIKDADKITHKEAADVLASINVMVGDDNGNFNPEANLTREQAAKIITYMLMGKSAADGLAASKAPFTDVKADRWSAGSIAYCVSQGILSGMGDGTFQPEATVTGTQFAKMLLTALGYDAKGEGLTGNSYAMNVARLVKKISLNAGVTGALTAPLTRDSAAQMALNTLNKATITYEGGANITGSDIDVTVNGVTVKGDEFYKVYTSLKKSNTSATYGRPGHTWKNGITEIGTYSDGATITYTASTKESVVKADLGDYTYPANTTVYMNGNSYTAQLSHKIIADTMTGAGRQVEIYTKDVKDSDNVNVDTVVIIDTYLAKVTTVNTVTKTVYLTVTGYGAFEVKNDSNEALYNKLVEAGKDAQVLITLNGKDGSKAVVASATVAESVTGKYTTKTSDGKRTIDGTSYDDSYATKLAGNKSTLDNMKVGTSYVVYLDTYGNVVGFGDVAAATSKTAFLMAKDLVGNVSSDNVTYKTKLLFEDGTMEWVTTTTINGSSSSNIGTKFNALSANTFVSYGVNADGTYTIKDVPANGSTVTGVTTTTDKDTVIALNGVNITKDKVSFLGTDSKILGSSKTVFLVGTTDGTYKVYTGIKNVPSFAGVSGSLVLGADTLTATIVVLGNANQTTSDYVYVTSTKADETYDGGALYTYPVVKADGTIGSITIKADSKPITAIGLYTVTGYSGDYVSSFVATTPDNDKVYASKYAKVSNGTVLLYSGMSGETFTGLTNAFVMGDNFFCGAVNTKDMNVSLIDGGDISYYSPNADSFRVIIKDNVAVGIFFEYTPA